MAELVELDDSTIQRMDRFAAEHAESVFDRPMITELFRDPAWHSPELDSGWTKRERWIECAERAANELIPDPDAISILRSLGHPLWKERALAFVDNLPAESDMFSSDYEIISYVRTERPALAEAYLTDPFARDPAHATRQDPDPKRRAERAAAWVNQHDLQPPLSEWAVIPWLREEQQRIAHKQALDLALTADNFIELHADTLRAAIVMRWCDIGEAMSGNPALTNALLEFTVRGDNAFDPYALCDQDILLAWSALTPSMHVARITATIARTDFGSLAAEALARVHHNHWMRDEYKRRMATGFYDRVDLQMKDSLSIVWLRCRPFLES